MELAHIYKQVFFACFRTSVYKKHDMGDRLKAWMPSLSEITEKVIQNNCYGLESQTYEDICVWWNSILSDILEGMTQRDTVLLEDAVEFGLKEFLECFLSEEELQKIRRESVDEQGCL